MKSCISLSPRLGELLKTEALCSLYSENRVDRIYDTRATNVSNVSYDNNKIISTFCFI